MTERERLIKLLIKGNNQPCGNGNPWEDNYCKGCEYENKKDCRVLQLADYLLANGVIVPPCKVGDTVYAKKGCFYLPHATRIKSDEIITCEVIAIKETKKGKFLLLKPLIEETFNMRSANDWFSFLAFGKTVFLTREEAEQALKGDVE